MQRTRFLLGTRTALVAAVAVALSPLACAQHETGDDADDGAQRLATGQWVTPLAPSGAIDQPLKPGLAAYPNFVAGEAVRSRLSPDGGFLYVDQNKTGTVAAFAVHGGSLTQLGASPFPLPAGAAPAGIVVS